MPGCVAVGCSNRSEHGKIMKVFPRQPERRKMWAAKVKRDNWKPTNNSFLCEDHFEPSQWEPVRADGKRKLKCNAIPTIFQHISIKKRRSPKKRQQNREGNCNERAYVLLDHAYNSSETGIAGSLSDDEVSDSENEALSSNQLPKNRYDHKVINHNSYQYLKVQLDCKGGASSSTQIQNHSNSGSANNNSHVQVEADDQSVASSSSQFQNGSFNSVSATGNNNPHLQTQVEKLKLENKAQQKEIINLKNRLRNSIVSKSKLRQKHVNPCKMLRKFLYKDQINSLLVKSNRVQSWSNETVKQALKLRFACGTVGYTELLKQKYPLPALRTLRQKVQGLNFEPGILLDVFEILKLKIEALKCEQQKDCVLLLDEMALTPGVDYDMSTQSLIGNVTLPGHSGVANKCLVFMLGGVGSRWKQTVAYYYTNDIVNGSVFVDIVNSIVRQAEAIGLKVVAVISDMGSSNQAMWKKFGIVVGKYSVTVNSCPHPVDVSRKLFFIPDVRHVFKNIKNTFINNHIIKISPDTQALYNLPSDTVYTQHIEILTEHQEPLQLKLVHNLSTRDLQQGHFEKMKVGKARNILSHEVSSGLSYLVQHEEFDESLKTTAWFVNLVDKWFKLMTSRHPVLALSKVKEKEYSEALEFLNSFISIFETLKFGGKGHWKPCQSGAILATKSILDLQQIFLEEKGYSFLLTSRFTQDCLENLFSSIRGIQPVPTAVQFKQNLKLVSVAQYLRFVSNSSYDEDDREFLADFLNVVKKKNKATEQISLPKDWCDESQVQLLGQSEQNALYNNAGYLVSRIRNNDKGCDICLDSLLSKDNMMETYTALTDLRCFKQNALHKVNATTFRFLLTCENYFRALERFLNMQVGNTTKFVYSALKEKVGQQFEYPTCHNIMDKLLNRFVIFRLRIWGKERRRVIKREGKVDKASKSLAMRQGVAKMK